jgi:Tol biopolymer transport system component
MMLAVHPSGREVAWLERGPEGDDLWLVPLSSEPAQPRRLTKDRSLEFNPSWSPDGRLLAYFDSHAALKTGRDGSIRTPRRARVSLVVLEPRTGEVFVVAENVVPSYGLGPAWTPDGGGLVWVGRNAKRFDPLMYAEISEGRAGPAQRLPTPKTLSHRDVAVRPAGPRWTIAYTGLPAQPGADRSRRRLYVLEMGNDAPGWAR